MDNSTNTMPRQPVAGGGTERKKTMPLPNNLLNVNYTSLTDFFKRWCVILRPFVKLTDKEIDVVSGFLTQRVELSKKTSDVRILDIMLMSHEIVEEVIKDCGITTQHFYVIMSSLRKKGIVRNNRLIAPIIPNIKMESGEPFRLLIQFSEKQ